MKLASLH